MNHPVSRSARTGVIKIEAISDNELTAIAGAIVALSDYQRTQRYHVALSMYTTNFKPQDFAVSKSMDNGFLDGYVQGYLEAMKERDDM